ncbi:MAG TPA: TlpA disulfide reductase family protein [Blastocatellia bacterium]|jgi:thiol-disulfide isomerase/thioredoxin
MKSLATLVILIALVAPAISAQNNQTDDLKPMPGLTLQDFDGKPVSAETLKGSIIVLDFWATWCGPCITEIPEYNKLQAKYADKGVKVVGVTLVSGAASEVKPFVARHNMKYTVLMGDDEQAYDFNIIGFPTTFIITPDMKIYKRYIGVTPKKSAQIEADIERLLEKHNGR